MDRRKDGASRRVRAAWAGGLGGAWLALLDLIPSVLWLPHASDRALLAARLFLLLPGLGALLAVAAVELARPRPRGGWLLLALAPALTALAIATLSGARISRLPGLPLWMLVGALALFGVAFGAIRLGARVVTASKRRVPLGVALLVAAAVVTNASRLLYPRHYDAIHGALSVAALSVAALGGALFVQRPRGPAWPWLTGAIAAVALSLLATVGDHDGRAALLSPRAANARSVLLAVSPALYARRAEGPDPRAVEAARRRRARALASRGLPTWPEAHLVLVTIDALRADHLGAYGYRRAGRSISPRLDAVAREGVRFDRAWTPTPRSSYAICSLMTGVAQHVRVGGPTLAQLLRDDGRYTAAFYPDGIFFHAGEALAPYRDAELGFERRDAEYRDAASRTDAALEEIADLRRRGEPRSFVWVHYFDVHEPYEATTLGTAPVDRYDSEILKTDGELGRLLDGLDAMERDVVLVISADHGEEHLDHGGRFHGGSLYEEQLRVPLIVRAPGLAPRVVDEPVSLVDVAPTVLAMFDLEARPTDGYDLRPLLLGSPFDRPPVRAIEGSLRAVLDWPHKLIEDRALGVAQVFDLAADPRERASLASSRPDLVERLRAELAAFDP